MRLAIVPLIVAAIALDPRWRGPRAKGLGVGLLCVAVVGRTAVLAGEWRRDATVFDDYARAAAALPRGGLMMMAFGTPLDTLSWQRVWSPPITSVATQVVGRGLFFPAIFANPTQQPLALRPEFLPIAQPWDLTDPAHWRATRQGLEPLCAQHEYSGVFLTLLYGSRFTDARLGDAVRYRQRDFAIVDACRLAPLS